MVNLIVGTRPNLIKIAPICAELKKRNLPFTITHTGQHFDSNMSKVFFDKLNIPEPNINLEVSGFNEVETVSTIMVRLDNYYQKNHPSSVLVVGDVNSTLAASIVAAKNNIPLIHVEAGLRSNVANQTEEQNRIVSDHLANILFPTTESSKQNLINEGLQNIFLVGNTMIDSLLNNYNLYKNDNFYINQNLQENEYIVCTIHRPENTNSKKKLSKIFENINSLSHKIKIILPLHPRTKLYLKDYNIEISPKVHVIDPIDYIRFMNLVFHSRGVISDSGGIQEETHYLKKPCLTIRDFTERNESVNTGINILVKEDMYDDIFDLSMNHFWKEFNEIEIPNKWDGKASQRIVDILIDSNDIKFI
jgi:UDP-N-acetylglucosamine 2-epimerase (non-hydrolysing)